MNNNVIEQKGEHNIMSFNMVHEIVSEKTVKDAKKFYTETFEKYYRDGTPSVYMEKLLFDPQIATGDPDESMTMIKPPYLQ